MKKKEKKKKLTAEQTTAQEFTNVLNIQNNYLYTRDGYVIGYIKIIPVSVGLLSQREKETLVKQLTAELSVEKEPFHFLAISRPVDMQPLLESYAHLRNETSDPYRRELLRKEMENLSDFTFGDEIVERQFFFYFSMKAAEDVERDFRARDPERCALCSDGHVQSFCAAALMPFPDHSCLAANQQNAPTRSKAKAGRLG